MNLVVDASVALKWFLGGRSNEAHCVEADGILRDIGTGLARMTQPPHFLAEVAAVLARVQPATADDDLRYLQSVEWEVVEWPWIYATAIELSERYRHHVFDTLYHATAIHDEGAVLVTADDAYYVKAHGEGSIARLQGFESTPSSQPR